MKFAKLAGSVVAAAVAVLPLSAAAQNANTVKIGKEVKKTVGTVKELQNGDTACMMIMTDDQGRDMFEPADFDICFQQPSLIGKRVSLKYKMGNVMAESCQGNPDCKKSDRIALVVEARILDAKAGTPATPVVVRPAK